MSEPALAEVRRHLRHKEWNEAQALLDLVLAGGAAPAQAWVMSAYAQYELGAYDAVDIAAERALALDPDDADAHVYASFTYERRRDFPTARWHASEAIRLAPTHWRGHTRRAAIDVLAGEIDEQTWQAARRAVELAPDEADARYLLGVLGHRAGDAAEAAREYRAALDARPDDAEALHNLALMQLRRLRLDSAAAGLVQTRDRYPDSARRGLTELLRRWLVACEFVLLLAAILLLSPTAAHAGHTKPARTTVGYLTDSAGGVEPLTINDYSAPDAHIAAGHPLILILTAATVLCMLLALAIHVARSLRPVTGRVVRDAFATDRILPVVAVIVLLDLGCLIAAAVVGSDLAHDLVIAIIVIGAVGSIAARIVLTAGNRRTARHT